jgi:formylglycine-generating enzyme
MSRISFLFLILFILGLTNSNCQVLDGVYTGSFQRNKPNIQPICQVGVLNDSAVDDIKTKKIPKKIRKYFKEMQFINSGTRSIESNPWYTPTKSDSGLLFYNHDKVFGVQPYLLCNHEVTNKEYREFTAWVRDSIARTILAQSDSRYYLDAEKSKHLNWEIPINWDDSILAKKLFLPENERFFRRHEIDSRNLYYLYAPNDSMICKINIYPDTLQWVLEFSYSFLEPFTQMYYWHPAYDNYPVVGVSWVQAKAYCHWKTEQIKNTINPSDVFFKGTEFRLPTELEWEYAATGSCSVFANYDNALPWSDYQNLFDEEGNYYANSGFINDINNVTIKKYSDDDIQTTAPVMHYKENDFGLYDMGGNAAEWVEDTISVITLRNYFGCYSSVDSFPANINFEITEKDNIQTLIKRIVEIQKQIPNSNSIDTTWEYNKERINNDAGNLLHDWEITYNKKYLRIIKGGSWADPTVYMVINMNQVLSQYSSSCKVGFRVAMSLSDEMLPFFYTDKYPKLHVVKKHYYRGKLYE